MTVYRALASSMKSGLVSSAHDCSDGGLAVALAECCFGADSGASIDISPLQSDCSDLDDWGALFGEASAGYLSASGPLTRRPSRNPWRAYAVTT